MICTVCGSACPEGARYCRECGAALPVPEVSLPEEPVVIPNPAGEAPSAVPPEQTAAEPQEVYEPEHIPENTALPQEETPAEEPAPPDPAAFPIYQTSPYQKNVIQVPQAPTKKGTHWIPIAIMAVLCVFGLVLFLTLPFGTADQPMFSDSETPWFYNDNGTLYFNPELYHGPEELTVPDMVDGQPVTALAPYCFSGCDFTTVILPDTLESIGPNAFDGCTYMRGIFLPEGLTYIGTEAFYCCSELEAICIPSTVGTIESGAFDGCFSLNYILYNGIHSHWLDLYEDMIGKNTQVYCMDGTFVHRNAFP